MTYLRLNSHRAREKAERLIGELDYYWTVRNGGTFFLVRDEQVEELLKIKGISRPRQNQNFMKCWPMRKANEK